MSNSRLFFSALLNDALDMVRDSSGGHLTTNNRLRAANRILDRIALAFDGEYQSRREVIEYLNNEPDYHLENNLDITDFKNPADLRLQDSHNVYAQYVNPNEFAKDEGSGSSRFEYTIETRNTDKLLRILYDSGSDSIVITSASDTTDGDATWAGTDDATTPAQDTKITKEYGSCIKFNIDIDASANDYATITLDDFPDKDLSDYEDIGKIRLWVFLPTATDIDSFTLRWGNDSSNYWELAAVTTNALGQSFEAGWNRIEFDWTSSDISETGTPISTAIDWLQLVINHSLSADLNGVRVNEIKCFNPIYMDFLYYTSFIAKNASGTIIAEMSANTDEILLPVNFREVVIAGLVWQFFGLIKGWTNEETITFRNDFEFLLKELKWAYGHTNRRPIAHIKVRK